MVCGVAANTAVARLRTFGLFSPLVLFVGRAICIMAGPFSCCPCAMVKARGPNFDGWATLCRHETVLGI